LKWVDGEEETTKYAKGAKKEAKHFRPQGNREKLSDRIYRIVQDLFFFRKALMKNM
jgi:hypothetical protein